MTTISSGISKLLTFKKQAALGTPAPAGAAGTSQYLRRVTSTLDKKKANYQSKEILVTQQRRDMRHGVVGVEGTISGEVSVGTYQQFEESLNRALSVVAATSTALTTLASASTAGANGTLTRTGGSFISDGFKVGMVVRGAGWAAPAAANNGANLYITALSATVMTVARLDKQPIVAKAAGDSITITEAGKHSSAAVANHTRDYYTIEHFFGDIGQSELFTDCVITQMDVKLPGSGMMTCDYMIKGLDMTPAQAMYFTSPAATSSGGVLASANGLIYLAGQPIALITGMNFSVKGNHTTIGGVVGSNAEPDIMPGALTVDGQVTILFTDAVARDMFLTEQEVAIACVFTADNTPGAGFKAYTMPRVKMGGATKDDGEKGLVLTMPFTALENPNGTAGTYLSTFVVQDSAFV